MCQQGITRKVWIPGPRGLKPPPRNDRLGRGGWDKCRGGVGGVNGGDACHSIFAVSANVRHSRLSGPEAQPASLLFTSP